MDVKGQNLKAQLSTSENIALRALEKPPFFAKFEKNKKFAIWKPDYLSEKMLSKLNQGT